MDQIDIKKLKNWIKRTKSFEGFIEFVEDVLGLKLFEYQKQVLKLAYEHGPWVVVMGSRYCGKDLILKGIELLDKYKENEYDI